MTTMSKRDPHRHIDRIMTEATAALGDRRYHDAERLAVDALRLAHAAGQYERLSRIVLPLQEARRQRLSIALEAGPVRIVDATINADGLPDDGCWVVQPPLVGADAKRLRNDALAKGMNVAVLCREPLTREGLCPVVAVGPTIVRTRVAPPKPDPESGPNAPPSKEWFIRALEELGDEAIAQIDETRSPHRRVTALFERLETVVEHEKLHQALGVVCREAVSAPPAPIRGAAARDASDDLGDADDDDAADGPTKGHAAGPNGHGDALDDSRSSS